MAVIFSMSSSFQDFALTGVGLIRMTSPTIPRIPTALTCTRSWRSALTDAWFAGRFGIMPPEWSGVAFHRDDRAPRPRAIGNPTTYDKLWKNGKCSTTCKEGHPTHASKRHRDFADW